MKNLTVALGLGFLAVVGLSAFTSAPEKAKSATKSVINWTGSKVVGGSHNGTISFKDVSLDFKKGKLVGGTVVADMTTITNADLEGEWNDKLVGHLNSDDFFSTAKYPTSTLKVTKVSEGKVKNTYNVTADLTIKGITKSQTFVATDISDENNYIISANVDVNRTDYNVRYGSSSFFDDLGDKAISDNFQLQVIVYTKK